MKIFLFAFLSVFALASDALPGAKMCVTGPGYWCSSTKAASQCGATEYCRQLRQRTGQLPPSEPPMQQHLQLQAEDTCSSCQQVLSIIQKAMTENKTQDVIAQEVKTKQCQQSDDEVCEAAVDLFLPEVLMTLGMDIQPRLLCTLLGMCNQISVTSTATGKVPTSPVAAAPKYRGHPVQQLMQLQLVSQGSKPLSIIDCRLCQTLVREARQLARDGGMQKEVQALLRDTACRLAPTAAAKEKCTLAISKYAPIIFELLSTELDPSIVCQALGACAASSPAVSVAVVSKPPAVSATASPQCLMCELVIREIDRQIGQNKSISAIETALGRVCSVLPQTLRPECDSFVQEYTPAIVHLLVSGLSPKRVCTSLGLCSASPTRRLPLPARWMRTRRRSSVAEHNFIRHNNDLL